MSKKYVYTLIATLVAVAVALLPIHGLPRALIVTPLVIIAIATLYSLHERHTYLFITLFTICCPVIGIGISASFEMNKALYLLTWANSTATLWLIGGWLLSRNAPQYIFAARNLFIGIGILGLITVMTEWGFIFFDEGALSASGYMLMTLLVIEPIILLLAIINIHIGCMLPRENWWNHCEFMVEEITHQLYTNRKPANPAIALALWNNRALSQESWNTPGLETAITELPGRLHALVYSEKIRRSGALIDTAKRKFLTEKIQEILGKATLRDLQELGRFAASHNYGYANPPSATWTSTMMRKLRKAAEIYGPEMVWEHFVIELLELIRESTEHNPKFLWQAYQKLLQEMERFDSQDLEA